MQNVFNICNECPQCGESRFTKSWHDLNDDEKQIVRLRYAIDVNSPDVIDRRTWCVNCWHEIDDRTARLI